MRMAASVGQMLKVYMATVDNNEAPTGGETNAVMLFFSTNC